MSALRRGQKLRRTHVLADNGNELGNGSRQPAKQLFEGHRWMHEILSLRAQEFDEADPRTRQDLALLHLGGLSTRMLALISKRLLGVEVSKDTVSGSLELLQTEARKWLTRSLSESRYWALYIDGTNFKVQRRGSTEREPSLDATAASGVETAT